MTAIDCCNDQEMALEAIRKWRDRCTRYDEQYLTLGGYAGTGKTTLIAQLAEEWEGVAVMAYCGKAANVLRAKGVMANTIHSQIYVPRKSNGGTIRFQKRRSLDGVETIIVDEASMIDHITFIDILSFGLPVLFVGDHGQLEPIGTSANLMGNPDLRLEKIHRQAADNPILRLATAFREGRDAPYWEDPRGRLSIVKHGEFEERVSPEIQMICGMNKTRIKINAIVRKKRGLNQTLVAPGEKLICLQNNPMNCAPKVGPLGCGFY